MLKHISKLLVLLCTTGLIGCVGYDKDKASTPQVEFADGSFSQCTLNSTDGNIQTCNMKIKFSKFNQSGLQLVYHINPDNNLTKESCDHYPKRGCGIAYDKTNLENSIKKCQNGEFATQNYEGTCDISFDYNLGKSVNQGSILETIYSGISIGITGGNGHGGEVTYLVFENNITSKK